MRRTIAATVMLLALSVTARADDAPPSPPVAPTPAPVPAAPSPPKPAPPPTLEQSADAVLAAVTAKDDAALKALAAKDAPDPWLVADELIRRGEFDAADVFAKAAPRVDVERLPEYVASRRGKPDDPARRERLANANVALGRRDFAGVLDLLGPPEPVPIVDVVGVRLAMVRGMAFAGLVRSQEASAVLREACAVAERLGWLACATRALSEAGFADFDRSDRVSALDAWTRAGALAARRGNVASEAEVLQSIGQLHRLGGDYRAALDALDRALAAREILGDRSGAAITRCTIGLVHLALGDFVKALSSFECALETQESLGDRLEAATTLGNIGVVHQDRGNYSQAIEAYDRALAIKEAIGDKRGVALTLANLGLVYHRLGEQARALALLGDALVALTSLGMRVEVAWTLNNIGNVHAALGDHEKALSTYERALTAQEALGAKAQAATTLSNAGIVHGRLGDYAKALSCHERALAVTESMGDRAGAANALGNLGVVHQSLGDYAKALSCHERALAAQEALGAKAAAATTLGNIGVVHQDRGSYSQAIEAYDRALAIKEAIGDKSGVALTLANLGLVHHRLGDQARALALLGDALVALTSLGMRVEAAWTLNSIGNAHSALGDHEKALSNYERALAAQEALGAKAQAATTLGNIGNVYYGLEDYAKATTFARRAVESLASTVTGLGAEDGASAREPLSFVYEVGARAAAASGAGGELAYFLETGRAGSLLEGLKAREAIWGGAIPDELRRADAAARAAETRAVAALRKALDGGDLAATKARRAELEAAQADVSSVVSRIQREAKAGASIVYPEAATLHEIRATLQAGDALMLYALFEKDAAALVVERESARIVPLGPRAPIDAAAEAVAEAFADDASDPAAARAALTDLVVKPLALGAGTKRVLVSPAGLLSYVPFAALMRERTVAYVPSGTTYRLLREQEALRGEGVLALGDPDYETKIDERALAVNRGAAGKLVRLPATRDEALAVGTTTLLGADATEAGLRKALAERKRWRAVHLACHGLVNTERPALSSLAITAAGDDDGFLTCLDVFRMKVPSDLVVLSACETGKGKVVKGEGIVGLTRAFMFAGSPRVLCSLWKVDDAATAALMTKFYELWNPKTGSKGLGTAEALRAAQEHVRSQEKWKHPYYWAAWVLWGLPS